MKGSDHLISFAAVPFACLTQESDWTDKDWTGGHTNTQKPAGETNLLSDWDLPSSPYNADPKLEVDKINMNKSSLDHDSPQEEEIQVTNSLLLPPIMDEEEKSMTQEKIDVETNSD